MIKFSINKSKAKSTVEGKKDIVIKELVVAYAHLVDIFSQVSGMPMEQASIFVSQQGNLSVMPKEDKATCDAYVTCWSDVVNAPSADVQSVKHGKWEELTDYGGWGDTHYRCSVCGEEWHLEDGTPQQNNMNFCPRCGSRMDSDADA